VVSLGLKRECFLSFITVVLITRCKSSECYLPIHRRSLCTNTSPQACTTISSCGSSRLCDTKVTRKDVADLTAGASGNESVMIPVKQLHVKII
jgi:hypothetical protein